MTALSDAARAVEEAAEAVLWDSNRASIAHLIAAVRHHDAEIVRAMDPVEIALAGQYAGNDIANRLDPTRCACEQHTDNESCLGPA